MIGEICYLDEAAVLKPLLHILSLSIEEHIYLLWTFVLIILYKLRVNIVLNLSILFLILFTISLTIKIDKFYNTLSSVWELCAGG